MADGGDAHEASYGLLLAFDTDDPEFCRGVEAGMLHERLQHESGPVQANVHAINAEMVLRISEATNRPVRTLSESGEWLYVEYAAASSGGEGER